MKTYRISSTFLVVTLGFASITALLYAIFMGRAHPFNTFTIVESLFFAAALLAWSFRSIKLSGEYIESTIFFITTTKYPLREVKRVTFERYGITEDFAIEFEHHTSLHLTNFDQSSISDILRQIRQVRPDIS